MTKGRLEAFTDGVVAITIMRSNRPRARILAALQAGVPIFPACP